MNNYAFWPYDLFPYVLGSVIQSEITVKDGKAYAYSPTYQGTVLILHTMGEVAGAATKKLLQELEQERGSKIEEINNNFREQALKLAPFLKHFPAYKDYK